MKKRKVYTLLSSIVILSSFLVGCGKVEKEKSSENESGKTTMTIHLGTGDSGVFKDNWPIFKQAEKKTGVKLKGVLPSTTTDLNQAFSLMIASGDIPDIVQTGNLEFFKNGPDGAFDSLDKLIDEHAPHVKKFFNDNPDVKVMATGPDGKIWFIPFVQDGEAQSGWFIRKDWLKKLNLEEPKSVEELYNVMTAFANDDPNGNGKKDEVPYFHRNSTSGINDLLSLWAAHPSYFVQNGKVKYGPITNEFGEAYENIAKWYQEGLIDKEIFTRGIKAREVMLGDNIGGVTHDLFASTGGYTNQLSGKIAGFDFSGFTPPANINGKIVEPTQRLKARAYGWGIGSSNKDKVKAIEYFDYWFTKEGRRAANYGIEGDTYTMVDGKPILTDKVLKSDKPAVDIIRKTGAQSGFGFQQDYNYEKQWTDPDTLKVINSYVKNGYIEEQYPAVKFTEKELDEINKILPKIETYLAETTQQWVLGSKKVDMPAFKKEMINLGADKLVQYNQKAYDRYMKDLKK